MQSKILSIEIWFSLLNCFIIWESRDIKTAVRMKSRPTTSPTYKTNTRQKVGN